MATERTPLIPGPSGSTGPMPSASFAGAMALPAQEFKMPQAIAHRGHKAAFPENSMGAFRAAVEVGAHAIETDLHLSRDGVVVLSHDATLKRCFGKNEKIAGHDWSYLSTLRTLREPKQPMPRLLDLLEYLARPENESIWVLLDIKLDDDGHDLLTRVASTISSVPATRPWKERIVLGAWSDRYLSICREILPGFPIALISFSYICAAHFLKQPDVHFNMLQKTLVGPPGNRFIKSIRRQPGPHRNLFVWTVNDEEWMEWSIRKQVDGVITDDPKLFLDVCNRYVEEHGRDVAPSGSVGGARGGQKGRKKPSLVRMARLYTSIFFMQVAMVVFTGLFYRRLTKKATGKGSGTGKAVSAASAAGTKL